MNPAFTISSKRLVWPVLLFQVALNSNGSVSSSDENVMIFVMLINAVLSFVNSHSSDCHGSRS